MYLSERHGQACLQALDAFDGDAHVARSRDADPEEAVVNISAHPLKILSGSIGIGTLCSMTVSGYTLRAIQANPSIYFFIWRRPWKDTIVSTLQPR